MDGKSFEKIPTLLGTALMATKERQKNYNAADVS